MAPDVLAQPVNAAVGVETGRGVQAAGAVELRLLGAQCRRQGRQVVGSDPERVAIDVGDLHVDGVERRLAANAATRRGVGVARQAVGIYRDMVGERHLDGVEQALVRARRAAGLHAGDVFAGPDHALRQQETECQVEVVARGAHRDGQGLLDVHLRRSVAEADLKRLLDGDEIGLAAGDRLAVSMEADVHAHALRGGCDGADVGAGR